MFFSFLVKLMNYIVSHLRRLDWLLIAVIFLLAVFSVLLLFAMAKNNLFFESFFKKQIFFYIIGFFLMFFVSLLNYRFLAHVKTLIWFYILALIILIAVLIFGADIRGTKAWFAIGGVFFQPVELVKIVLILILAKFFSYRHIESYSFYHLLISALYVFIPMALVLAQPDLGSALVMAGIWTGMILIIGIRLKQALFLIISGVLVIAVGWNFMLAAYQKDRILNFLNPSRDPFYSGYNLIQSKIAIGSGGFFGEGLGRGTQTQFRFLPEPHTDFILSSIGEEMGLSGIALVFILFSFLLWRIIKIAIHADDNFAKLFNLGFIILIFSQFFINVSMVIGFLPVVGIGLPFLSYGGSSLLSLFIGLGITQAIHVRSKTI